MIVTALGAGAERKKHNYLPKMQRSAGNYVNRPLGEVRSFLHTCLSWQEPYIWHIVVSRHRELEVRKLTLAYPSPCLSYILTVNGHARPTHV